MAKRYAIGIDLGTTNCSLASIDLGSGELQLLPLPQWDAENQLLREERLPSFLWILPKALVKKGGRPSPFRFDEALPFVVGREARGKALTEPDRVIHSAKSWLSTGSVHGRTAKSLPWGSAGVEEKMSPIEVQSRYLRHMREAWNEAHPDAPFDEQAIVITVPASFDDLAQRLSLEAAKIAGYPENVTLLEEPQAAFYDWHQGTETKRLNGTILVCDVGGGTSDFTLLRVDGDDIERLRVSEHILLGGDNIDLGIAHEIARRLSEDELPRGTWNLLLAQTRHLKERALAEDAEDDFHISIPKDPLKLFGDYYSASIPSRDLRTFILDGYFPSVERDARVVRERQSPLQAFGLPYAQDSAITRHLAEFLAGDSVDALLCVGGSLLPPIIQERLLAVLQSWQKERPIEPIAKGASDLAVARGAARFAYLRASDQKLVRSAFPRTLLIELESQDSHRYLTLIPRGHPRLQASRLTIPGLHLRVGSSVRFQLYSSLDEAPEGSVNERQATWQMLPPLETRIPKQATEKGKRVESLPVSLEATVRETGVLEIIARGEEQSWALDFPLDPKADAPRTTGERASDPEEARQLIREAFAKGNAGTKAGELPKVLEKTLGPRETWSASTLRALWPALESTMFQRQAHEANWFYLAGYSLRPGWGFAGDEDRIASLLRIYDESFRRVDETARLSDQWCILWRRVAGGLPSSVQQRLFERYMPVLRKDKDCSPEIIRLLGSLERLDATRKAQLGRLLVAQFVDGAKAQIDARAWALARVASRIPLYAGAEAVLPPSLIEEWADQLEAAPTRKRLTLFYAWAGRRTGDKQLDLDPHYRDLFRTRLAEADESLQRPVSEVLAPDIRWQQQMFGESLPSGFVIY